MWLRVGGEIVRDIRLLPRHTTSDQRIRELGVEVEDGRQWDEDRSHRIVSTAAAAEFRMLVICNCVAAVSMNSVRGRSFCLS